MPNWCENILSIEGADKEIECFADTAENGQILSFDALMPTPAEMLKDEGGDGRMPAWYNWRCDNWGTRADACECKDISEFEDADGNYDLVPAWVNGVYFWTAWSPPIEFVVNVSKMFPTLTFDLKYYEGGMLFAGQEVVKNGGCILAADYDLNQDEHLEECIAFVRENFDSSFGDEESE